MLSAGRRMGASAAVYEQQNPLSLRWLPVGESLRPGASASLHIPENLCFLLALLIHRPTYCHRWRTYWLLRRKPGRQIWVGLIGICSKYTLAECQSKHPQVFKCTRLFTYQYSCQNITYGITPKIEGFFFVFFFKELFLILLWSVK